MDYGALIPLAAFFVAIQLATRANAHPLLSASVAVLIPYAVVLVVRYIFKSSGGSFAPGSLFPLSSVFSVLLQFLASVYIFKRIRDDDSIASTIAWGIGGFILVVLVIPYIAGLI